MEEVNALLPHALQGRKAELLERLQEALAANAGGDQADAAAEAPGDVAADAGDAAVGEEQPAEEAAPEDQSEPAANEASVSWLVRLRAFVCLNILVCHTLY